MKPRKPSQVAHAESMLVERLWLVSLPRWINLNKATKLLGEKEEAGALIISQHTSGPKSPLQRRIKAGGMEIRGRPGWLANQIIKMARLGPRQAGLLRQRFQDLLPGYAKAHWLLPGGAIRPAFLNRGVVEQIRVDLALVSGFGLWEAESLSGPKGELRQVDLKRVLGPKEARGLKVTLTDVELPSQERLELVAGLPAPLRRKLKALSPAGEVAAHSLDMALRRAIQQQRKGGEEE